MRILTFASLFPNKIDPSHGIFVYQRSAHLAKRPGNDVVVVSPVPYFPQWLKTKRWQMAAGLPSEETFGDLRVYHPRYFLLPKIFMPFHALSMFIGCLPRTLALNKEKRIDCIDAHFVYPDGMAAILLGKILNVPVTISARGTDINLYPSYLSIRPMIKWTLKRANGVIAVSGALKEAMIALGIPRDKAEVIPNGIDATRFSPVSGPEARKKLGLADGVPLLVSVGALISSKGHELLVQAVEQILPRHPELQVYIIGEGPFRGPLEKLVKELHLGDHVHLPGKKPNEELPLWFSAADLSCLASLREGWPNVVTESLACGTPVLATRVGGIPEILHSPDLGILVEYTTESIVEGIEHGLSIKWDRVSISRRNRARTWAIVAAEVERVLGAGVQLHSSRESEHGRIP